MEKVEIHSELRVHSAEVTPSQADSVLTPLDPAKQRRYPRIKCFLAIQLRPADQGLLVGKLSEVSLGGCGVESSTSMTAGTPVALCPLAADGSLWVEGVVVNARLSEGAASFQIGVRFLDEGTSSSSAHNVKEFVRFVEEVAAKQDAPESYLHRLARGKA